MTSRVFITAMAAALGCAPKAPDTAASPQAAADCGSRYAVTVRDESGNGRVFVYHTDARLIKPAVMLGQVGPRDERTFYFRSDEPPAAWAEVDGVRVFPNDRSAAQRLKVRIVLRCDEG